MNKLVALFVVVLLGVGCATSGVAKPATSPALLGDDDLSVVSGQLMLRSLSGATVVANGQTTLTNGRGVAAFANLPVGADLAVSYPEHLRLETLYRGRSSRYTLWPLVSGMDQQFIREFAFSFGKGVLRRFALNTTVYLVPVGELRNDEAKKLHQQVGEELTAAVNGQVQFLVTQEPPVNSTFFLLKFNPKMKKKYAAMTLLEFYGDNIVGGVIQYRLLKFAQNHQVVKHELVHTLGIGHTAAAGLMNAYPDDNEDLTPVEILGLANAYRYKAGTTLKHNIINDRNTSKKPEAAAGFVGIQRKRVRRVSCQLPVIVMDEPRHIHR